MSKVVFYSVPLYAHSIQTFPIVKELIDRGEEVIYYTNSNNKDKVKNAGAEYREYLEEYTDDPGDMFWNFQKFVPKIREIVDRELVNLSNIKPDYLILDRSALWGPFLADVHDLHTVCLSSSFAFNKEIKKIFPQKDRILFQIRKLRNVALIIKSLNSMLKFNKLRKDYNFPGDPNPILNSDLVLIHSSRSYQPFVDSVDSRHRFIGWIPSTEFREEEDTIDQSLYTGEDIIYISSGTTFNRNNDFFETCFEAFNNTEYQVILSTGRGKHVSLPKNIPDNFLVREWVPQMNILKQAKVFITQGGTSSISESLYFGCPVVVVPQAADQFINGYRVEQLGTGKNMRFGEINPSTLRTAVDSVIGDPDYHQNCIRIGDSLRAAGGEKTGVDEIFKFKAAFNIS